MEVTVVRGDNLSTIAKKNGVTVREIMKANPQIKNANVIKVGQKINVPTKVENEPTVPSEVGKAGNAKLRFVDNGVKTDKLYVSKGEVPYNEDGYANLSRLNVAADNAEVAYYHDGVPVTTGTLYSNFGDVPVEYVEDETGTYLTAGNVLPELEVVAKMPKKEPEPEPERTWWDAVAAPYRDLYNTMVTNRVNIHKNPDNWEVLEAVRDGGNLAGNMLLSFTTLPYALGNATTAYALASSGLWLPLLTGLGGAYAGYNITDNAVEGLTGMSLTDHMRRGGMWDYNIALTHPGANIGGFATSKATLGLLANGKSWLYNSVPSRTIYGPQGPAEVPTGTTYEFAVPGGKGGSVYKSNIGVHHGGAGASNYGNHKVTSGGGYKGSGTGWSYKPEVSFNAGGRNGSSVIYSNPYMSFSQVGPGVTYPWLSWPTEPPYNPPTNPPVNPPINPPVLPEPETRVIETSRVVTPWEEWYAKQPEGTVQYYDGPDKKGWYVIDRSGGNYTFEQRRVGNAQGYVAPDSTTVSLTHGLPQYKVTRAQGGVDPRATIDYNLRININDIE